MDRTPRVLCAVLLSVLFPIPVAAQDARTFYDDNCAGCHTIGGGAEVGPDLAGITERRPRAWLVRFLLDPPGLVASNDPTAVALVKEWDGAVMDPTEGLTPALAERLLDFIDASSPRASRGEKSTQQEFAATSVEVHKGRLLFDGAARLTNGGAPCAVCHAAGPSRAGTLAPALTTAAARLRGPRALASWLDSPPTPMMRALYRTRPLGAPETHALAAFLNDAQNVPPPSRVRQRTTLGASALAGAMGGFLVAGVVWRRRFRAVRRPMVDAAYARMSGGRGQ